MAEVRVPEMGESIVEGTISQWLKNVGDTVNAGDAIAELETDKVNLEVMAEVSGVLASVNKQNGDTVTVGEVIAVIDENGSAATPSTQTAAKPAEPAAQAVQSAASTATSTNTSTAAHSPAPQREDVNAPPSIRKLAREKGVSVAELQKTVVSASAPQTQTKAPDAQPSTTSSASVSGKPEERVRMSRRRQTIAKRLVEAQHTAAMLTTFNEVDMTAIMNVRKRRKDEFKDKFGVGLGFMSFFTKAVVGALKQFPRLNAEIQGEDMILKHYYDIGVAVSTGEGLVVPVVRDADKLTFAGIEKEIASLAARAREGKLTLAELSGGTFTITNGGIFGSLMSTPILNAPQVGILGMHGIKDRPIAVNGQVEIRPMMYIALSYDHRIVDGSEAVRFLAAVKNMVEDPESLLLEG
ncbi:2-oxoglutarate dehydrogenase complex dihydrolipoyllysine-residue succinyltransferase [Alicyclobacillus sp. TC]|uniref:2-oxoglutarate dehydrogenase complex dihydrolipoyllysine-residue succinyltransferase n=1 Tax=Alicyclobacillus sp. TC TaxID=2606450 RepID=UPI001932C1F8|nr:2-oxoglutarate dehydrogenase complex dihydrolipoyllysine-residue succinyltransferase [Alicyclobacillus sp. TC]QRF22990.1 2-oxoglutarate dehydrogenase complex dihydrolipoyllysine-residue succinyltransferase [Alicyclobacillus sp. TC]